MEKREWRFKDKSKWGDGPWQQEPDKKQWIDEATGLPCLIVRANGGALCGYVGVTKEHPWFGIAYEGTPEDSIEVHGGLTFSDKCVNDDKEHGICHIVSEGEDGDVWWFGFDCAHAFDVSPAYEAKMKQYGFDDDFGQIYRTVGYVEKQVASLAKQLMEAK